MVNHKNDKFEEMLFEIHHFKASEESEKQSRKIKNQYYWYMTEKRQRHFDQNYRCTKVTINKHLQHFILNFLAD